MNSASLVAAPACCVLCGAEDAESISDVLRDGMEADFDARPHECGRCGFVFLHPRLSPDEEAQFYRAEFRRRYHGQGYDLEAFHAKSRAEATRRVSALREGGLLGGNILELGAATGAFLEEAAPFAHWCYGVEPDEAQREFAGGRGLLAFESIEAVPRLSFNLVVAFHVLEHVGDPVGFLKKLEAALVPGGTLVVEVPNVDDALLSRLALPEFERFYFHPAHVSYFSAATLAVAARAAGLEATVTGVQRYSLGNHLHWAARREPGGQGWLSSLLSAETEASYARDLVRALACDTLWMVARRPQ